MKRLLLFLLVLVCFTDAAHAGNRHKFKHWSDLDKDGQDTRVEELISQALTRQGIPIVTVFKNKVISGLWLCPYSGLLFSDPKQLQVDHVVALEYAYTYGADKWTDEQRELFANDPFNLLVVSARTNKSKGQRGPSVWLPPDVSYSLTLIERFAAVCEKYKLQCKEEDTGK